MSRLDSFIRRVTAQKLCLEACAREITGLPGAVVELGLGNGRTFDHLREILPDREIYVVERQPRAHPSCTPDERHLIIGDLAQTLPGLGERLSDRAVLLHSDIGCGDPQIDATTSRTISHHLPGFLASGAWIASDQRLSAAGLEEHPLPTDVAVGRYFVYRWRS